MNLILNKNSKDKINICVGVLLDSKVGDEIKNGHLTNIDEQFVTNIYESLLSAQCYPTAQVTKAVAKIGYCSLILSEMYGSFEPIAK